MSEENLVSKDEIAGFVRDVTDRRKDQVARNKIILAERHAVRMDEFGSETLDPTPVELPIGHERPMTLQEQIARLMVKQPEPDPDEMEEDDEFFLTTPYELVFDPVLGKEITAVEFIENQDAYQAAYEEAGKALSVEELKAALNLPQGTNEGSTQTNVTGAVAPVETDQPTADSVDPMQTNPQ